MRILSAIVGLLALSGTACASSMPAPAKVETFAGTASVASLRSFYGPRETALRWATIQRSAGMLPVDQIAISAKHLGALRDAWLGQVFAWSTDLERADPSLERSAELIRLYEEEVLACGGDVSVAWRDYSGGFAKDDAPGLPLPDVSVSDPGYLAHMDGLKRHPVFTPFPLTDRMVTPYIGDALSNLGWAALLSPIDVALFPIGLWFWGGRLEATYLPASPSTDARCAFAATHLDLVAGSVDLRDFVRLEPRVAVTTHLAHFGTRIVPCRDCVAVAYDIPPSRGSWDSHNPAFAFDQARRCAYFGVQGIVERCENNGDPTVTTFANPFENHVTRSSGPGGLTVGLDGTLYIAIDPDNVAAKSLIAVLRDGRVQRFAGDAQGYVDGPLDDARFTQPIGLGIDERGRLLVLDAIRGGALRRIDHGEVETIATGVTGDEHAGTAGIAVSPDGQVFVTAGNRIRVVRAGVVTTFAGDTAGFHDGGLAEARFRHLSGLVFGPDGTLYATDSGNHAVRAIRQDQVTTVAGDGKAGLSNGPPEWSRLTYPQGLALQDGSLYVTEWKVGRVRRIPLAARP